MRGGVPVDVGSCKGNGLAGVKDATFCHFLQLKQTCEELDVPVLRALVVNQLSQYLEQQVPLAEVRTFYESMVFDAAVETLIITSLGQAAVEHRFEDLDEYAAYGRYQNKELFDAVMHFQFGERQKKTRRGGKDARRRKKTIDQDPNSVSGM